jgi:hypothetical protein
MNYNYIHNEKEKNCLANTTPHLRKQKIMYQKLPNATLLKSGHLSRQFRKIGIFTFHDACDFVWKLPYGRTSDKSNWLLVLSERTGTCSTKHALLKALANELSLNINLVLGIYPMKESNTPGVGTVLEKYGLEYIPEAHCYLEYKGKRVDLTRHGIRCDEEITEFFIEKNIDPDDIGEKKQGIHKNYIKKQYGIDKFKKIWAIREQCIGAL